MKGPGQFYGSNASALYYYYSSMQLCLFVIVFLFQYDIFLQ